MNRYNLVVQWGRPIRGLCVRVNRLRHFDSILHLVECLHYYYIYIFGFVGMERCRQKYSYMECINWMYTH